MYSLEELLTRPDNEYMLPMDGMPGQRRKNAPLPTPPPIMQQSLRDILARAAGPAQAAPLPQANPNITDQRYSGPMVSSDAPRAPVEEVHVGQRVPTGSSALEQKLARYNTLSGAGEDSKVKRTDWGYEEMPPALGGPSRKKQALVGLLQGLAQAGQATGGNPWGTLAGGLTGMAAGAISPRTMQAFTRQQELDKLQGEIGTEQKMEMGNAQISETLAQASQRRADAEMVDYTDPESGETYQVPAKQISRVKQQYAANKALRDSRAADDKRADAAFDETKRANKEREVDRDKDREQRAQMLKDKILEERSKAGDKPNPAREAQLEAEFEGGNEQQNLQARKDADESTSALRAQREKLTHKSVHNSDGTWGWAPDARMAEQNASQIANIDRQISFGETEARDRQHDANAARVRKDKAMAKAQSAGTTAQGGTGKNNLTEQQVRDAATKANLDPDEAVRRARAKGRLK